MQDNKAASMQNYKSIHQLLQEQAVVIQEQQKAIVALQQNQKQKLTTLQQQQKEIQEQVQTTFEQQLQDLLVNQQIHLQNQKLMNFMMETLERFKKEQEKILQEQLEIHEQKLQVFCNDQKELLKIQFQHRNQEVLSFSDNICQYFKLALENGHGNITQSRQINPRRLSCTQSSEEIIEIDCDAKCTVNERSATLTTSREIPINTFGACNKSLEEIIELDCNKENLLSQESSTSKNVQSNQFETCNRLPKEVIKLDCIKQSFSNKKSTPTQEIQSSSQLKHCHQYNFTAQSKPKVDNCSLKTLVIQNHGDLNQIDEYDETLTSSKKEMDTGIDKTIGLHNSTSKLILLDSTNQEPVILQTKKQQDKSVPLITKDSNNVPKMPTIQLGSENKTEGQKSDEKRKTCQKFYDEEYLKKYKEPFKYGWKRELVNRRCTSNNRADVYYWSPENKKLRSYQEVKKALKSPSLLTIDNFTFHQRPLGICDPNFEIIRTAKKSEEYNLKQSLTRVERKLKPKPINFFDDYKTVCLGDEILSKSSVKRTYKKTQNESTSSKKVKK